MTTLEIILRDGPPMVLNEKHQIKEFNTEWWETPAGSNIRVKIDRDEDFHVLKVMARATQINVITPAKTNYKLVNPYDNDCRGTCFMCQLAKAIEKLPPPYNLRRFALTMLMANGGGQILPGNHHLLLLRALGRYPVSLVVAFPLRSPHEMTETFHALGTIRALYLHAIHGCTDLSVAETNAVSQLSETWLTDFSISEPWSVPWNVNGSWKDLKLQPMDKVLWMRHFLANSGNAPPGVPDNYVYSSYRPSPLAYALRVQRARISNMHDIFTLIMCTQRFRNHRLFRYTNRDVVRKILSNLRPADFTDAARDAIQDEGTTKRRRKLSTALEPLNPTWVHNAVSDFQVTLKPHFEDKESEKSKLANWDESQADLVRKMEFHADEIRAHQKRLTKTKHLIVTSAERRIAQMEKAEVAERNFQQQFAPFREKYRKHL